jgi:hypothetical protein
VQKGARLTRGGGRRGGRFGIRMVRGLDEGY